MLKIQLSNEQRLELGKFRKQASSKDSEFNKKLTKILTSPNIRFVILYSQLKNLHAAYEKNAVFFKRVLIGQNFILTSFNGGKL